ncbi:MAG: capsule assembly Wzi family protein [Gemmatimonadota bacterium]|nr:capsule assembly Wzi family protein [Gemmatimonadota bacterium]
MKACLSRVFLAAGLMAAPGTSSLVHAQDKPVPTGDTTGAVPAKPDSTDSAAVVSMKSDSTDSTTIRSSSLALVTSEEVDRLRFDQLVTGVRRGQHLLLRSASSLRESFSPAKPPWGASLISPQFLLVTNSRLPFSQNNGALWAGRGSNSRTLFGFVLESPHASLIFAPEVIASDNAYWLLRHDYYQPPIPEELSGRGYALHYYYWTFPIDQPMRFGNKPIRRFDLGESSAIVSAGPIKFGVSNENHWWGPGIRNAILLSNNARGFPHLFLRTAHPVETRLGSIDVRWLVGGLTESRYFDTVSTNNVRSLSSIAATLQTRWDPNLTIGAARSVYATAKGWGDIPWRWFHVFAPASRDTFSLFKRPVQLFMQDSTFSDGSRDQLFSLFARWVFPADGFELNVEWARTKFPASLHDFLVAPNHTQGYTLGLQWRSAAWRSGTIRLQGEVTQLEQSATFRDRPVGSWYTSRLVIQGYTNRGQVIGASIGPGASTQWLAIDYLKPQWRFGAFAGRIRWNEDVHSTYGFPLYVAYCNHDISIYPGIRGAMWSRFGWFSADLSLQNRLNVFFQNGGGCPNTGRRLDIRNTNLSVTLSPFQRR